MGGINCLCCCSFFFMFNNPYVSILLLSCNSSQNAAPGYTRDMLGFNKVYDLVMTLGQAITSVAGTSINKGRLLLSDIVVALWWKHLPDSVQKYFHPFNSRVNYLNPSFC